MSAYCYFTVITGYDHPPDLVDLIELREERNVPIRRRAAVTPHRLLKF